MSDYHRCFICDLPLCSPSCPLIKEHLELECSHFAKHPKTWEHSNPPYASLLTVRILLLQHIRPNDWATFLHLESLGDEWRTIPNWLEIQEEHIALVQGLGLPNTKDEVLDVLARCYTNTFSKFLDLAEREEEPVVEKAVGTNIRVAYVLTAMISHSCIPNSEQSMSSISR